MRYRLFASTLAAKLAKPFVHILFGARQTGKSTLLRGLLPQDTVILDLSDPQERARFAANPGLLIDLCHALPDREGGYPVFIDEAQMVSALFDAVQSLYDSDKERYRFILCGSSARKLRSSGANLLPGRSIRYALFPLVDEEYEPTPGRPPAAGRKRLVQLQEPNRTPARFPARSIESRLVFGDLPGVALLESDEDRRDILTTYATAYLEEEIRRETVVKDWGYFLRFLKFSAGDSGGIVNLSAISRETGISSQTVKAYYQLLEDMFVGFVVPAFSGSSRKSALSSPRFFYFDNGVRNAAAKIPLTEGSVNAAPGPLFEHWVAGQLWRKLAYDGSGTLSYYRTSDGAEVDFIVKRGDTLYPIEVKWSENPTAKDARHLRAFIRDNERSCPGGVIVSRCPHILDLGDSVTAIPWWLV